MNDVLPGNLAEIPRLVAEARRAHAEHIELQLLKFERRRSRRLDLPTIAFLGYGRAGKDEAAAYLAQQRQYTYAGSTSEAATPLVAQALGCPPDVAYRDRHQQRMFWKAFCEELRKPDPTILVRMSLANGDVLAGLRGYSELKTCLDCSVINIAVWVDRPDVPPDPTVDFTEDDCHLTVRNAGSLAEYHARLDKLFDIMGLPRKD